MLHLTFNISCFIACLCAHLPSSSENMHLPLMGFLPLGDGNVDSSLQVPSRLAYEQLKSSVVDSTPARSPYFAAWIFLSQSQNHSSVDGIFFTSKQPWSNSVAEIFPTERLKVCSTVDGTTPTRKQYRRLTKSLTGQTNNTSDRDQHSEVAW